VPAAQRIPVESLVGFLSSGGFVFPVRPADIRTGSTSVGVQQPSAEAYLRLAFRCLGLSVVAFTSTTISTGPHCDGL
jgi:hypothetical protein